MTLSYGLPLAVIRARINLSSVLGGEDPMVGWQIATDGFEDAKRNGSRDMMTVMGMNAVGNAIRVGEWDSAAATVAELAATDLAPPDRYLVDCLITLFDALRGRPFDASLERAEAFARTTDEPQVVGQISSTRAWLALVGGQFGEAFDESMADAEMNPPNAAEQLPVAARAALWAGRADDAKKAADQLAAIGVHGRAINASLRTIEAGLGALTGDAEMATVGYRDAIRQWRDIGAAFDLALCELDFVKFVGGENPDAKAAAEEAEGIFQRLGAPAFVQRLNDAVGLPVV
jgi:hypothetical protein